LAEYVDFVIAIDILDEEAALMHANQLCIRFHERA
jgi:hypothetical protein